MIITALIDGERKKTISILDRGLHYGDGLFETVAVHQNKPLCLNEHLARLSQGCKRLGITSVDLNTLRDEVLELAAFEQKAVIKIIITRGEGGRGYALPDEVNPSRIILLYHWPQYNPENTRYGINARVCQYRYSHNVPLAGIKHLNCLIQIMARLEWVDEDIAEGILLDQDGHVIEGTMSNIFMVKAGQLLTPELIQCGIAGIVRGKIMDMESQLDLRITKTQLLLGDILDADELFFCNSIIGLWPIRKIDKYTFPAGKLTKKIQGLLQEQQVIVNQC